MNREEAIANFDGNTKQQLLATYTKAQLITLYKVLYNGLTPRATCNKAEIYELCIDNIHIQRRGEAFAELQKARGEI